MANKRPLQSDGAVDHDSQSTERPSRKRRIEYSDTDAQLAPLYQDLSDEVKSVRLTAAAQIVRTLRDTDASVLDRALTRLIRGLCSSRKAARSGFFVALTEVFRLTFGEASGTARGLSGITQKILDITTLEDASNNQERRNYLLGRCFGFKALIQSTALFQQDGYISCWEEVVGHLLQLASENVWLRKECGIVLHESLSIVKDFHLISGRYVTLLLQLLSRYNLAQTPEGLAIWLTASSTIPDVERPKGVWHHSDPLASKSRAVVAKILRDNSTGETNIESNKGTNSGAAQSQPSFAWEVVITHLCKPSAATDEAHRTTAFEKFWKEAVDSSLFAEAASVERKALGLQVLSIAIPIVPAKTIPAIFTQNVMRCILNQRADKERYLHQSAKVPLVNLVKRAKKNSDVVPPALQALLGGYGTADFDSATATKTIDDMLGYIEMIPGARETVEVIEELVLRPRTDSAETAHARRQTLMGVLLQFARKQTRPTYVVTSPSEDEICPEPWSSLIEFFVQISYFEPTEAALAHYHPDPPLSQKSREAARSRLTSALNHLLSKNLDPGFDMPFDTALQASEDVGTRVSVLKLDSPTQALLDKSTKTLQDIGNLEEEVPLEQITYVQAMKLLYSLSILQVYNEDADAASLLEDLDVCYKSFRESEDASSMLVEILLSFLAKPSSIFRKLAEQVFAAIAPQLTEEALDSLLDILKKKEDITGQQELFDQADDGTAGQSEGEDDEDDDSIDGEDASDVEMVDEDDSVSQDGAEDSDASSEESDDDNDDDSGSEVEGDGNNEEVNAFEQKLIEALGTKRVNGEADGASTSDESDMDDEQMMALDGHLTTIFKERSKQGTKKKDNKDAKETIVNFKSRVLDLFLIYVKQEYNHPMALKLLYPIAQVVRTTSSKPVSEKAFNVIKQLSDACNKNKKYPSPINADEALNEMRLLHQELRMNASKLHTTACSRASLFLAKIITSKDRMRYRAVADLYSDLQKEWYTDPKSHIQQSIFTEWTSWSISTRRA